jgi:signal transduction histidine kinase
MKKNIVTILIGVAVTLSTTVLIFFVSTVRNNERSTIILDSKINESNTTNIYKNKVVNSRVNDIVDNVNTTFVDLKAEIKDVKDNSEQSMQDISEIKGMMKVLLNQNNLVAK